jgi:hypothetical protein
MQMIVDRHERAELHRSLRDVFEDETALREAVAVLIAECREATDDREAMTVLLRRVDELRDSGVTYLTDTLRVTTQGVFAWSPEERRKRRDV